MKQSKASVNYSLGGDHCGACTHFIEAAENEATETGLCELVKGPIGEDMWCKLFERRPSSHAGYHADTIMGMGGMARHIRKKS